MKEKFLSKEKPEKLTINIDISKKSIPELVDELRKLDEKRIKSGILTPEEFLALEDLRRVLKKKS